MIRATAVVNRTSVVVPARSFGFMADFASKFKSSGPLKVHVTNVDYSAPKTLTEKLWYAFTHPPQPKANFWNINYYTRSDEIMESLNIAEEKREDFMLNHDFSQGVSTLEFALPLPIPSHIFLERVLIKEHHDPADSEAESDGEIVPEYRDHKNLV
eukprot:TRINITY_DN4870_c0_g1_i1.p2 TRINITY_DN4870_c0_g1~~TRINITY_DN4870_c0_g1_i1.p2  ORF type:complete len:171 (-),score=71.07 TRINITY_DN4870_c0_g1_i1:120-587(-)